MSLHVRQLVSWLVNGQSLGLLVGQSVIIFLKGGKLNFNAPIVVLGKKVWTERNHWHPNDNIIAHTKSIRVNHVQRKLPKVKQRGRFRLKQSFPSNKTFLSVIYNSSKSAIKMRIEEISSSSLRPSMFSSWPGYFVMFLSKIQLFNKIGAAIWCIIFLCLNIMDKGHLHLKKKGASLGAWKCNLPPF